MILSEIGKLSIVGEYPKEILIVLIFGDTELVRSSVLRSEYTAFSRRG